jgi:hypothetical protein
MDTVLFCPFCGEAFEGPTHCPEHELTLVPWAALPKIEPPAGEHEPLPWHSPRGGRAWVATGAALILLAFAALPLARVGGALHMGGSMLRLALAGTPRLWLVPAAAWAELLILYRRRTPRSMRGARLAAILIAGVPALAVLSTWLAARQAVALLAERTRAQLFLHIGAGAYAIWLATLPLLFGAARLGAPDKRSRP